MRGVSGRPPNTGYMWRYMRSQGSQAKLKHTPEAKGPCEDINEVKVHGQNQSVQFEPSCTKYYKNTVTDTKMQTLFLPRPYSPWGQKHTDLVPRVYGPSSSKYPGGTTGHVKRLRTTRFSTRQTKTWRGYVPLERRRVSDIRLKITGCAEGNLHVSPE